MRHRGDLAEVALSGEPLFDVMFLRGGQPVADHQVDAVKGAGFLHEPSLRPGRAINCQPDPRETRRSLPARSVLHNRARLEYRVTVMAEELEDGSQTLDPDELVIEPAWWDEGSDGET